MYHIKISALITLMSVRVRDCGGVTAQPEGGSLETVFQHLWKLDVF